MKSATDQATSDKVTAAMADDPLTALFHWEGGSLETYRAMVTALDDGVGQVLDAIAAAGMSDDTIVVFTSDNGGERYAFLWPFVGGFWVMALAQAGLLAEARAALQALAEVNARDDWRFTEWFHGRTLAPMGMAGQSWNAATFLLAHRVVHDDQAQAAVSAV